MIFCITFYLVLLVRVDDERELLACSVLSDLLAEELLVVELLAGAELTLVFLLLEEAALVERTGAVVFTDDLLVVVLRVF